ncbi:hypothetical protein ACB092_09G044800 [Castanea dentata]
MAPLTSSFFINTPILFSSPHCKGYSTPTLTPIFSTCTINFSLINWSPYSGQVSIGTPAHIVSMVEFQPQCVKNPPTEGFDNMSNCGAQPQIKRPLPLILSSNLCSKTHFSNSFDSFPSLIAQMNGLFDASKPNPSSINCEGVRLHRLPRET